MSSRDSDSDTDSSSDGDLAAVAEEHASAARFVEDLATLRGMFPTRDEKELIEALKKRKHVDDAADLLSHTAGGRDTSLPVKRGLESGEEPAGKRARQDEAPPPSYHAVVAVDPLRALFPDMPLDDLLFAMETGGDFERAADMLLSGRRAPAGWKATSQAPPRAAPAPAPAPSVPTPVPARSAPAPASDTSADMRELRALFPDAPADLLRDVLRESGSLEAATHTLLDGSRPPPRAAVPAPAAPPARAAPAPAPKAAPSAERTSPPPARSGEMSAETLGIGFHPEIQITSGDRRKMLLWLEAEALQQLSALFPRGNLIEMRDLLEQCGSDLGEATAVMRGEKTIKDVRRAALCGGARPLSFLVRSSLGPIGPSGNIGWSGCKLPGLEMFLPGGIPPASIDTSFLRAPFHPNVQSLRSKTAETAHAMQVVAGFERGASADVGAYPIHCFQIMLERERVLCGDYCVFYHSYSYGALLYEIQAELARHLYDLPDDFPPLPRLLKAPYDGKPTMEHLLAEFSGMTARDHDPKFREIAISASNGLFGQGSEVSSAGSFTHGASCADLSFRGLLDTILEACDVDRGVHGAVCKSLVELATRYSLYPESYRTAGQSYGASAGGTGHLLQIFVRRDYVDEIAYHSAPFGVIIPGVPLSVHLMEQCTGQARIFVHPAAMMDGDKVQSYYYAAKPAFMSFDPGVPGSRGAFLQELREILHPVVGSYATLRRALAKIEALASLA